MVFKKGERREGGKTHSHAGFEQDSEPSVSPDSELWFGSQTLIPASFVPELGSQLEDLLCVSAAAAAGDAAGGLLMVVSVGRPYPSHTYPLHLSANPNSRCVFLSLKKEDIK